MITASLAPYAAAGLAVASAARGYVGKARWRHRGRQAWALDCVGLVVCAHRAAGYPLMDVGGYGREPWQDMLRKQLRAQCGEPIEALLPGDIAVIQWFTEEPHHLAIVGDYALGGLSLIHVENLNGCVEHRLVPGKPKIIEGYRAWHVKFSP